MALAETTGLSVMQLFMLQQASLGMCTWRGQDPESQRCRESVKQEDAVTSASELQKGHGAQSSLSPKGNQTPGTQAAGAVALPLACLQPAPLGRELHRSQGAEEEGAGLRPALLTLCG